jgi:hypothetical protein
MRNGTFTNQTIHSISFALEVAKWIDMNGDGHMEIIVIGYIEADIYIGILWIIVN